jgi:hypothetical protein
MFERKNGFKMNDDPRLSRAYSVAEAAHYLRMHQTTLRSWNWAGLILPADSRGVPIR